jgi:pentatricopeptide repeat domain-containing protein 1
MRSSAVKPDVISFNTAIDACAKAGQWERALSLLVAMKSVGVTPNVRTFNCAIAACDKGNGQWERAMYLLNEMRVAGVPPDAVTFNSVRTRRLQPTGQGGVAL